MKRIFLGAPIALALAAPALAQTYLDTGGTAVPGFVPIAPGIGPIGTASHPIVVTGITSASFSGFTPTPAYAQLAVGATSARVALPAGTVVIVYNTGANAAFVALGNSSVVATTSGDVIQPNSWMAFTVGTAGYLAAIETAGATTLNISGGAGLPTGAGGGSGNGGSVPTGSAGSPSASVVTVQGPTSGGAAVPVSAASLPLPTGAMPSSGGSVGISGTLPGFASTPTFNIGTTPTIPVSAASLPLPTGAATAAGLTTINSTLGTPMQNSGGSVTANAGANLNTSLLGTAANQSTIITDLGTLHADLTTLNTTAGNSLAAGSNIIGYVSNDPCAYQAKLTAAFSGSAAEFVIIANASGKKTTICSLSYRIASAANVSVVTGTGATCGTSAAALSGSTTAASGLPEAANGGEAFGSGAATVMASGVSSGDVCILQSGTALIAGSASYVQN